MKVDFMIIGAQKSGTTSLSHYLSSHPQVCFCLEKEPDFFNLNTDWESDIHAYHELFRPADQQILGEASTSYTMLPEFMGTPQRIWDYNPNLKLIYITRDPIERMISHYAHRLVRKNTKSSLREELLDNPIYVDRSKYFTQIKPYIDLFGAGNILLLLFEDFIKHPQGNLVRVANFLKIDPSYFEKHSGYSQKNKSTDRKVMPEGGWGKVFRPLKSVRRYIPEVIISNVLKLMGNSITDKPDFPDDLKKQLYGLVKEDIQQFKHLYGSPLTNWEEYL